MHMDELLPPIERPKGLTMKLAYHFTRRQFGKVLTPSSAKWTFCGSGEGKW